MLLRARRLFDGRTPKVFRDWVVEVEDGRILDVGPRSRAASWPDAGDVVDLGDVTLLPGLIDAHQHLVFDASDDPVAHLQAQDDATVLQWMHRAAQRALAVGITTIRDLGDRNYLSLTLRDLFRDSHEVGPRILTAGPPPPSRAATAGSLVVWPMALVFLLPGRPLRSRAATAGSLVVRPMVRTAFDERSASG